MVALFGSICEGLNDDDRAMIARLMVRKLENPLLGRKFGDSIHDPSKRKSVYTAIIQRVDLSRLPELVELVRGVPDDEVDPVIERLAPGSGMLLSTGGDANGNRTTCGEQLLVKFNVVDDCPRVLQAIAGMALNEGDRAAYEATVSSLFRQQMKGKPLTDEAREAAGEYVSGISAEDIRDRLASYMASLEIDPKDPSSLAKASANWDVPPDSAFHEALSIPDFANGLGVNEGFGFSSTLSPHEGEGRSTMAAIMTWLVPRAGVWEIASAINDLPSEELKAAHAEAFARSYAKEYGAANARGIALQLDAGSSKAFLRALEWHP